MRNAECRRREKWESEMLTSVKNIFIIFMTGWLVINEGGGGFGEKDYFIVVLSLLFSP